MSMCSTVSAVECIGDSGRVVPHELTVDDLGVCLTRPLQETPGPELDVTSDETPIERLWLSPRHLSDYTNIAPAEYFGMSQYDVVVILAEVPVPDTFQDTPPSNLAVDIRIDR